MLCMSPLCPEHAASGQEGIEHLNPSGLNPWPTSRLHCAWADVRQEGSGPPERIPCTPTPKAALQQWIPSYKGAEAPVSTSG